MPNQYHGTNSTPPNVLRTQLYLRKWFEAFDPDVEKDDDESENE